MSEYYYAAMPLEPLLAVVALARHPVRLLDFDPVDLNI